ncbi:hypothetical protein C8F04DRAFT_1173060 [Mycena alexandri]|uniref:Uncharacterized protein n=1 Tax=Mycena alexandri TaxID=1745969 RepID=A0AAD6TI34_9AGAR|nr:hypothetical protein C8F04DRAFT_1173060 [Mycena alexandri]
MVNHRRPFKKSRKNVERVLWSRLYPTSRNRPFFDQTRTVCETAARAAHRYPRVEPHFESSAAEQPHIHSSLVLLKHGKKSDLFRVFYKRGMTRLSRNRCTSRAPRNAARLVGEILFMRYTPGADSGEPISMQTCDAKKTDYIFNSPTFRERLADFQGPRRAKMPTKQLVVKRASAFRRK